MDSKQLWSKWVGICVGLGVCWGLGTASYREIYWLAPFILKILKYTVYPYVWMHVYAEEMFRKILRNALIVELPLDNWYYLIHFTIETNVVY